MDSYKKAAREIFCTHIWCSVLISLIFYLNLCLYFPHVTWDCPMPHAIVLLCCVIILSGLVLYGYRSKVCRLEVIPCKLFSLLCITLLASFQVVALIYLRVTPSWDFGTVLAGAQALANGEAFPIPLYYAQAPNNLPVTVLLGFMLRISHGGLWIVYALNMAAILVAVIGLHIFVREWLGQHAAALAMLLCLLVTPFFLYTPIIYTDTLSMPFPILSALCWRRACRSEKPRAKLLWWFGLGMLSGIGFLIKALAGVVLVAALVEAAWSRLFGCAQPPAPSDGRPGCSCGAKCATVGLAVFAVMIAGFDVFERAQGYTDREMRHRETLPYTFFVMMGMNKPFSEGGTSWGYGGFSQEDYDFTAAHPGREARITADWTVIHQRMAAFGWSGYARFLLKKLEWTWTDGSYFACNKLGRQPLRYMWLHDVFIWKYGHHYRLFSQSVQGVLLIGLLWACLAVVARRKDPTGRMLAIATLGLMVFLLIWETRPRYLVFFLPVLVALATAGLDAMARAPKQGAQQPAGHARADAAGSPC